MNVVVLNTSKFQAMIFGNVNSTFKGCLLFDDYLLRGYLLDKKHQISHNILSYKVLSYNIGIGFKRLHYLFPIFNEKIEQLITAGFFDHYIYGLPLSYKQPESFDETEAYLYLKQLTIIFEIWLAMLFVSFLAFIAEIIHFRVKDLQLKITFIEKLCKAFRRFRLSRARISVNK